MSVINSIPSTVIPLSYAVSVVLYVSVFLVSAKASSIQLTSAWCKVFWISLLPFLLAGFRYNVGWDFGSYLWGYENFDVGASLLSEIKNYQFGNSIGLFIIQKLTKLADSRFLFFAVSCALCYVPGVTYLVREWDDQKNLLPMMVFISGFLLYPTGLSAIKQGAAIGFCIYSLTYVYNRNFLKFCVCILIGFIFHSTAIVFFPVYFFLGVRTVHTGWRKYLVIFCATMAVTYIGQITAMLGSRFEGYGTVEIITNNYMFYLVLFWSFWLLVFYRKLVELDSRNELLILMYFVGLVLMFTGFHNAFTKRIASYFTVTQVILLPQFILMFRKNSEKILKILLAVYAVGVFLLLNSGTAYDMAPVPYSIVFWG